MSTHTSVSLTDDPFMRSGITFSHWRFIYSPIGEHDEMYLPDKEIVLLDPGAWDGDLVAALYHGVAHLVLAADDGDYRSVREGDVEDLSELWMQDGGPEMILNNVNSV